MAQRPPRIKMAFHGVGRQKNELAKLLSIAGKAKSRRGSARGREEGRQRKRMKILLNLLPKFRFQPWEPQFGSGNGSSLS